MSLKELQGQLVKLRDERATVSQSAEARSLLHAAIDRRDAQKAYFARLHSASLRGSIECRKYYEDFYTAHRRKERRQLRKWNAECSKFLEARATAAEEDREAFRFERAILAKNFHRSVEVSGIREEEKLVEDRSMHLKWYRGQQALGTLQNCERRLVEACEKEESYVRDRERRKRIEENALVDQTVANAMAVVDKERSLLVIDRLEDSKKERKRQLAAEAKAHRAQAVEIILRRQRLSEVERLVSSEFVVRTRISAREFGERKEICQSSDKELQEIYHLEAIATCSKQRKRSPKRAQSADGGQLAIQRSTSRQAHREAFRTSRIVVAKQLRKQADEQRYSLLLEQVHKERSVLDGVRERHHQMLRKLQEAKETEEARTLRMRIKSIEEVDLPDWLQDQVVKIIRAQPETVVAKI